MRPLSVQSIKYRNSDFNIRKKEEIHKFMIGYWK